MKGKSVIYIIFIGLFSPLFFYHCNINSSIEEVNEQPNVILIYADDLGYGDVSCYNPQSKIQSPNIDKLAAEGMLFVDAHIQGTAY